MSFWDYIDLWTPDPEVQSFVDYECMICHFRFDTWDTHEDKDVIDHLVNKHNIKREDCEK